MVIMVKDYSFLVMVLSRKLEILLKEKSKVINVKLLYLIGPFGILVFPRQTPGRKIKWMWQGSKI